jgi:ATP-dependent DNA helicase RecQ
LCAYLLVNLFKYFLITQLSRPNISETQIIPKDILSKYWGYEGFRPLQEEIINQLLNGKDTLALLPTGGGKSICYQVPGLILDGLCIVISPLLALINDQVEGLKSKGINAATVNSQLSYRDIDRVLDNCIYGKIKFLFISPERIANELFRARLEKMKINMLAVDEAHCISQWGHDFRPAYREISQLRELLPNTPVLALTATATADVVTDIQKQLIFGNLNVIRQSFSRSNIQFISRDTEDKRGTLIAAVHGAELGAGIIYVRNRRRCKELAETVKELGLSATHYHAGLGHTSRAKAQAEWMSGKSQWIVATNAFGMGIDKADVRTVIHYDISDGIESYYQEAGRAGRDGKPSKAIQIFNASDIHDAIAKVIKSHPSVERVKDVYRVMSDTLQLAVGSGELERFGLDIAALAKRCGVGAYQTIGALKCLEQNGYIQVHQGITQPSRLQIIANRRRLGELESSGTPLGRMIHALIRSRSGLFTDITSIREEEIAQLIGLPIMEVSALLEQADRMGIIQYIPRTGSSSVTYLTGRILQRDLRLDTRLMHTLRERSMNRQQRLNQYLQNSFDCRSRQLMSYFDEISAEDCGSCDVCLKNATQEGRATTVQFIKDLRDRLSEPQSTDSIKELCNEELKLKTLRWAVDKGYISISEHIATWTGPRIQASAVMEQK